MMRVGSFAACCVICLLLGWQAVAEDFVVLPIDTIEPIVLYKTSHALVIGINEYSDAWPPLKAARNDARAIAQELSKHGFSVTLKTDSDQRLDKPALAKLIDDFV